MGEQPPSKSRAEPQSGVLLVLSGPSGSGKSTLVRAMLDEGEFPLEYTVSVTTREPRPGEADGREYYFVDGSRFEQMCEEGELLEWACVHDHRYGTPRAGVDGRLRAGRWVLLEIDPQGYAQVRQTHPGAVGIFVRAASLEAYAERLRGRGTEDEETIARRVADAEEQLAHAAEYDFQIVNESLPQAVRTLRTLLRGLQSERVGEASPASPYVAGTWGAPG